MPPRARADASRDQIADYGKLAVTGWRRENGRVGVRNHVVILPLDDLSNSASEAVANNVKGTMALPHAYGRLQFGADLDLFFRTLIGIGANPNVAAVIVIGIEESWTKRVVDGIAKTGKPVTGFGIEGHGDIATIARASYVAKEYCIGPRNGRAKHARCRSSGSRPNAASSTRPRVCRHVRQSATCTTS